MNSPPALPPKTAKPARIAQKSKWAKLAKKPSKALSRAARALYAPALALAVALGCSIEAESTPWEAMFPNEPQTTCAQSYDSCLAVKEAALAGRVPDVPRGTVVECRPAQRVCFDARSLCIPGYEGPRRDGYCR